MTNTPTNEAKETEMESNMPTRIEDLATDPFWSELLYTDGKLDPVKVANELCDYATVWKTLGEVIDRQAGNRMTGCYKMYTADAINTAIDESQEDAFEARLSGMVADGEVVRVNAGAIIMTNTRTTETKETEMESRTYYTNCPVASMERDELEEWAAKLERAVKDALAFDYKSLAESISVEGDLSPEQKETLTHAMKEGYMGGVGQVTELLAGLFDEDELELVEESE